MFNLIFPLVRQVPQRWSEKTSAEATVEETFELDGSGITGAVTRASSQPGRGSTGSVWDDMFGKGFGKLKQEPKPEKGVTEPLPELETDVVEPEPTPVLVEVVEPAPEPTPVTEDPSTPDLAPEPETNSSEPAPSLEETTTPDAGETEPFDITRAIAPTTLDNSGTINVAGGRVTTFALPDDANVTNVVINALPTYGNVTVNPDLTLALVLSGSAYSGPLSFDYTVTHNDGTATTHTATLDVAAPTQAAGWALGDHYMLETDENGKVIVEHGDNHRKVYVSGSDDALTRADIAARENISETLITANWLLNNPEYGGSEGMALATDVGMELWYAASSTQNSNWLMFERGYTYEGTGRLIKSGHSGESELTPMHITSWGTGERPIITDQVRIYQEKSENVVFTEVAFTGGVQSLSGHNLLFSNVTVTEGGFNIQKVSGFTLYSSEVMNVVKQEQLEGDYWTGTSAGIFVQGTDGILIEDNFIHHNGWMDDYLLDGSVEGGAPPNMFSHNVYLQNDTLNVTFRDNIVSQGSSNGLQLRGGGFAEGNVFLDNNIAGNIMGGDYQGAGPIGSFTLFLDNLITSAGYKITTIGNIGAVEWGIRDEAFDTTLLNNIIAHKADPNNTDEIIWKSEKNSDPLTSKYEDPFFDNSKIYNWSGHDTGLEGLSLEDLNQITIQNFALQFLGLNPGDTPVDEQMPGYYKSGLMTALLDYAEANWGDGTLTAQNIIDWFQQGFGFDPQPADAATHRFIPNDLGDGVRWDNRLNWTSDALPTDGDTVYLGGNWVNFGGTVTLAGLDLGSNGKLQVGSGKLSVNTLETGENGGMIFVERAGQLWTNGYDGDTLVSVQVTGGRFANTGDVSGPVVMNVLGGQALLGADDALFSVGQESELRIDGSIAKVGFDGAGNGVATLQMHDGGKVSFVADAQGVGRLTEFRSGAWDQEGSNVHSGVALNGTLALDLSNYIGTGSMTLIEVDAIAGMFDQVEIHGLGNNRDAILMIDYAADLVTLELSSGTGQSNLSTRGDSSYGADEDAALWDALTAGMEQVIDLDAPITIFDDVIEPLAEMSFI